MQMRRDRIYMSFTYIHMYVARLASPLHLVGQATGRESEFFSRAPKTGARLGAFTIRAISRINPIARRYR